MRFFLIILFSSAATRRLKHAGAFSRTFHESGQADHSYDNCLYSYRLNNTDNFWFHSGGTRFLATKLDYLETVTDIGKDYNMIVSSATEWYVKGIGLVKSESQDTHGNSISSYTLVKAKINGHTFQ